MKICGLSRPEDVEAANALGPDMVGFVFHRPSGRCVSKEGAEGLSRMVGPSIAKVGVFVDEDPLVIADLVRSGIIDTVQLHGAEDGAYIRGLRRLVDVPIIKAFIIRGHRDLEAARICEADRILLDAGKGSGDTFDWDLLEGFDRDFILSGGLSPSNIEQAIARVRPFGVDVSSGVETDGRKDPAKMSEFVARARAGQRCHGIGGRPPGTGFPVRTPGFSPEFRISDPSPLLSAVHRGFGQ